MAIYNAPKKTINYQFRIPVEDMERLKQRYPDEGKIPKVLRALVQMHLANKIGRLEYSTTERL